jgi:uncharacterized membrane protein
MRIALRSSVGSLGLVTRDAFLFVSAFLASGVEMVEALTIVLAVGVTRGWRSTLTGAGAAAAVLAIVVAVLGPAVSELPFDVLRIVVGGLLLVFGLQWLRKAILRASGYVARHDETAAYANEREEAQRAGAERRGGMDWYAFTVAFKGVFLEGLEVAFIVITFGAARDNGVALAAAAAGAAFVVVAIAGAVARAPLARVPENTLKFAVGLLLTTFSVFWGAEGAGATWPGGDAALPAILALLSMVSLLAVRILGRDRVAGLSVAHSEARA